MGPCHVSGIFLPLRVNSLPLATIYEVKTPLRKWKISLLQRNPAHMTWAMVSTFGYQMKSIKSTLENSFEIYFCLQVGITISCHFRLLDGATLHLHAAAEPPILFLIIIFIFASPLP
jgi:hypothetical protein